MAEGQTNAAMVSFEHSALGSASEEFKRFDLDIAVAFFRHLDEIVAGRLDHWKLVEFAAYRGVPIYKAEIDSWIMVYAVEEQSLGDRKATVLFCGRFGRRSAAGGFVWDGQDVAALREELIGARAGPGSNEVRG
jgi:hypothetical protein